MKGDKSTKKTVKKREIFSLSEWRSTQIGMWAWLLQRFSALFTVICVSLHLVYPYEVIYQILMIFFISIHAVLGLRVIILDISKRVVLQKILFISLMLLGAVLFFLILKYRIFYF